MGIDAQLLVRTTDKVSQKQVQDAAYDMAEAFGVDHFWITRPIDGAGAHHCLQIVEVYTQDGPDILPKPGETLIEVSLWTRYYGPGYERGDLPLILAVAYWLEKRFPGAAVWYGGDSSGVLAEPFGLAEREVYWSHFCENGHKPYRGGWGQEIKKDCDFCCKLMVQAGWGANYALLYCPGCGLRLESRDGGANWTEEKKGQAT